MFASLIIETTSRIGRKQVGRGPSFILEGDVRENREFALPCSKKLPRYMFGYAGSAGRRLSTPRLGTSF